MPDHAFAVRDETADETAGGTGALRFTDAEIARFVERFDETESWTAWERRPGGDGADVIEVRAGGRRPSTLRIAKAGSGAFVASGFSGWSLAVCEDFEDLLDAVAVRPRLAA